MHRVFPHLNVAKVEGRVTGYVWCLGGETTGVQDSKYLMSHGRGIERVIGGDCLGGREREYVLM